MNLKGKHILITAGPTREYIDPVRFISNDSSGAMGIALAHAAKKVGARVTLICGPVNPPQPPFFKGGYAHVPPLCKGGHARVFPLCKGGYARVSPLCKGGRGGIFDVISAREMFATVKKYYMRADIIICAAAVSDWRPARCSRRKIKKNECVAEPFGVPSIDGRLKPSATFSGRASSATTILKLVQNPDILAWLGRNKKKRQCLIGFALETENVIKNAIKKLNAKRCDIIVANHVSAIGAQRVSATIISKGGVKRVVTNRAKQVIAREILKTGEKWMRSFFQGSNSR